MTTKDRIKNCEIYAESLGYTFTKVTSRTTNKILYGVEEDNAIVFEDEDIEKVERFLETVLEQYTHGTPDSEEFFEEECLADLISIAVDYTTTGAQACEYLLKAFINKTLQETSSIQNITLATKLLYEKVGSCAILKVMERVINISNIDSPHAEQRVFDYLSNYKGDD